MVHKVHVAIVLDRSGSMEDARRDAIGAINAYFQSLRDDASLDARLSVVMFDSHSIDTVRDRVPAGRCVDLRLDEYQPRGGTPLLDAVGYSVGIIDCLTEQLERRILVIVTDGLENSSREYTRQSLKTLLDRKQKADGWLILYLGSGRDCCSQANQIGILARHTADFSIRGLSEAAGVLQSMGSRFLARAHGWQAARKTGLTRDERLKLVPGDIFIRGQADGQSGRPAMDDGLAVAVRRTRY